jgi:esterase/lipase superfamily enzyme
MQKQAWTWPTPRLPEPARLVRWGHFGVPVLIFPTAGGDLEEIERFHLIAALAELIDKGRIKAYSVDGIAVRACLSGTTSQADCLRLQDRYDSYLYEDVLPRIRQDCHDDRIEPILVGASLGAAVAVGTLFRHPDSFRTAIGLSGRYEPAPLMQTLSGSSLERLRHRTLVLGSGAGDYEIPDDSRRMSNACASNGIPCRLSLWGPTRDHTWSTWRDMLPGLLAEQLAS